MKENGVEQRITKQIYKERKESGLWTQYCYNIDYLNGWLYGAVQAINRIMKPIEKEGI